jgi:hypothetical protein
MNAVATPPTPGDGTERRRHQRKVKPFYVAYSSDGAFYTPAYGIDISQSGLGLLSQDRIPDGPFKVRVMLAEHDFVVTVKRCRDNPVVRDGKTWHTSGVEFVAVDPEDERFLSEYILGLQPALTNATLSDLESTFCTPDVEVEQNQRAAPRKQKPFYIAFSINDIAYIPAYGLDISRDGMRLFTDGQMPEDPFKVRILLHGRDFKVTLKKTWDRWASQGSKDGWLTGTRFVAIAPPDREFVECYANGEPFYEGSKLLEALEELKKHPERPDRCLPPEILNGFLQQLVALKRLAPLTERRYPLVRYRYEGARVRGGETTHVVHVESRMLVQEGMRRFSTRFGFDQAGLNLHVL